MHVISRKVLREFCERHADARDALYDWYRFASKAQRQNLVDVQATYPKAESVRNFTVFNIKGNHYRYADLRQIKGFDTRAPSGFGLYSRDFNRLVQDMRALIYQAITPYYS